jgi:hypothetical protein
MIRWGASKVMFCSKCSRELPAESKFCNFCGQSLPISSETVKIGSDTPEKRGIIRSVIHLLLLGIAGFFALGNLVTGTIAGLTAGAVWLTTLYLLTWNFKRRAQSIVRFKLGGLYNFCLIITALLVSFQLNPNPKTREVAEREERETFAQRVFDVERDNIRAQMKSSLAKASYDEVLAAGKPHESRDPEIKRMVAEAEAAKEKAERQTRIETVRARTQELLKQGDTRGAWELIAPMEAEASLNELAKDVRAKFAVTEEKRLLADLKQAGSKDYAKRRDILVELVRLSPSREDWKKKLNEASEKAAKEESKAQAKAAASLELIRWSWHQEHGYAIAEGQVKNLTSESLKNVAAMISIYDKKGQFISSDDSLIEYNPLLQGQTSPFKIMVRWNPEMSKANVEFKFLFGQSIPHYQDAE